MSQEERLRLSYALALINREFQIRMAVTQLVATAFSIGFAAGKMAK